LRVIHVQKSDCRTRALQGAFLIGFRLDQLFSGWFPQNHDIHNSQFLELLPKTPNFSLLLIP
jgi:hypothetical protein